MQVLFVFWPLSTYLWQGFYFFYIWNVRIQRKNGHIFRSGVWCPLRGIRFSFQFKQKKRFIYLFKLLSTATLLPNNDNTYWILQLQKGRIMHILQQKRRKKKKCIYNIPMSKWIMEIRMEGPFKQWRLQFRENTVPLMFLSDYTAQHLYCSSNKSLVFPF